ncbi:MAG TPA: nucleotidyltransferase domain-containing protein [Elusimicrobiota bacterium]|nr:nucleotidyltransferase domain-containing protein [Elusimicrobiota bacterium]
MKLARFRGGSEEKAWLGAAVRRIVKRTKPQKVILFGSHAYGRPRKDSDLDLLVVLSRPRGRFKRYRLVSQAIGERRWPMDLLVRRPREIDERLRIGDSFFREIISRGEVLYES